ncbi:APH-domain-containing protein [Calocera cornea HHB12733]|uniref:APH-domain-containing protein n=1 Tax=Calocera cornea HHB12733 TaxID=1353952 RepID=A0A165DUE0_9BASI|nr:APH-domain-containing protein [Calocera cornea HHB12733]
MASGPPTISLALQAALEQQLGGPFISYPVQGGSSAGNSLAFLLAPLPSSSTTNSTNPFVQLQELPKYVLKIPQNPYSRQAIHRERQNLPALNAFLGPRTSTQPEVKIPQLAPVTELPLGAMITRAIDGMDGARAWNNCQHEEERLSLCRAFGRAARWVHSLPPNSSLPGPLRTTLPSSVAEDVHSPAALEEQPRTARDWLRLYLRAESARLAPRFTALVPEPEPPITSGQSEVLEGPELRAREREQERAIWCITTMERALADASLWGEGRDALCFIHGDWTLPNILVQRDGQGGWKEVAVVDWGDCGVADRRYDLREGVWSVLYNAALSGQEDQAVQEGYVQAFLEAYVGAGEEGLGWVLQDWNKWLELKRVGGGAVREGYWEAWAAAYEVWDLLVADEAVA